MSDCVGYVAGPRLDATCMEWVKGAQVVVSDERCAIAVVPSHTPTWHLHGSTLTIGMRTSAMPQAHGVTVRWAHGVLEITADDHEQRRMYWHELPNDGGIVFATRLDLLPIEDRSIDHEAFVGQWCSVMNVSAGSLFSHAHRVPSHHRLRYDGRDVTIDLLDPTNSIAEPDDALRSALDALRGYDVVLGLSGGFDSRTLMASLLQHEVPFRVHTYGTADMPDVQRALEVSRRAGVDATFTDLSTIAWDVDDVLSSMRATAWQSEGTYNGAHAVVFDDASARLGPRAVLVDGGYGALLRGGFGNALLLRHADALRTRDARAVSGVMRARDASLLREDLRDTADELLTQAMQRALDDMPAFDASDGRTWVDAFFLRWNPRGYVAAPQAVYDARLASCMPFLARDVVASVMSRPASFRAEGRWFRSILRGAPSVARAPFVGKRSDVPWWAAGRPTVSALWSKLARGYPPGVHAGIDRSIYRVVRPAMLDLAAASTPAPFDLFDQGAVRGLLERTTADGDAADIVQLLVWLGLRLMGERA